MKRIISNQSAFSQARDLLLEGESVRITVRGQSMLPFFQSGSTILLRPIRKEDFRVGHVVMAESAPGRFVVHRIHRLEGDRVILLGDGNLYGTETMSREKVYGIVDCGWLHLRLAALWRIMQPLRRYPLAVLRRICPK